MCVCAAVRLSREEDLTSEMLTMLTVVLKGEGTDSQISVARNLDE